ncbi:dual OB domain-containing protein [Brevundimonas sp.]
MKVYIVGRTKMAGSSRCIGGLLEDGTAVRLVSPNGQWTAAAPFQIGQAYEIVSTPLAQLTPPHTEDVVVQSYQLIGSEPNIKSKILSLVAPSEGNIGNVFGKTLKFTGNNNGYISQSGGVPKHSTEFWIPNQDLILRNDGKHYDYKGWILRRGLAYVGELQAIEAIPAGTLVRVSLARWWKPDDVDIEERCYAQLSGWFV